LKRIATAVLLALTATLPIAVPILAQGVERVEVFVRLAPELINSLIVFAAPINVSNPLLFTLQSVYVTTATLPRLSFAFSALPTVAVFAEPYAVDGAVYEVWYGGSNPYPQHIALPGTNASIWYAFDEFDYATEIWLYRSASVAASKASVREGGYMALRYAYPLESTSLWLLTGRRALLIIFKSPVNRFVTYTLTPANFTDFNLVRDGADIYFADSSGSCLYYAVLYFSKSEELLVVSLNPANNTVAYMLYGGDNPCTAHRVL